VTMLYARQRLLLHLLDIAGHDSLPSAAKTTGMSRAPWSMRMIVTWLSSVAKKIT